MALNKVRNVIYFAAVMYNPVVVREPEEVTSKLWGEEVLRSETFDFDHTAYYTSEMGGALKKYFAAFGCPSSPELLPNYKLAAVKEEDTLRRGKSRIINIDPGYLAAEKIVVASTKNFTHRVFIGDGIYGDLQLMRRKDGLTSMPWTYEDYKRTVVINFFDELYSLFKAYLD